jgi:type I restriction enzyme S subunit
VIKEVTLDSILTFIRGITFKPEDKVEVGSANSVVCLRTKNIQKELDERDLLSVPERFVKRDELYVKKGDILISSANSWNLVGKCVRVNETLHTSTIGGFISLLRPDVEFIDPDYLYRFLSMDETQNKIRHLGKQTTNISNLDRVRFLQIKIPLPPLETQKQIAAVLEKADQLRKDCKQMEQELNSLAQSVFIDMFGDPLTNPKGWEPRLLKEFYDSKKTGTKCGPFGSALKKGEYVGSGIPVWNMSNITLTGKFIDAPSLWITEHKFKDLESYGVMQGDVIISRAGTVGKMGVVNSAHDRSIISTNLIRVRFGTELHPLYFVSLMTYCKTRLKRLKVGDDGSFSHMSTGVLDDLEFPYPPVKEQHKYVKFRKKLDLQICQLVELNAAHDVNFNSLMQKAFKGELSLKSTKKVA